MTIPYRYRTTSTVTSATSLSVPDPNPPRRFSVSRPAMPSFGLGPGLKAKKHLRKPVIITTSVLIISIFFLSNLSSPDRLESDPDDVLRYSDAAAHFRTDMTREQLQSYYENRIAELTANANVNANSAPAPVSKPDVRDFLVTDDVTDTFFSKCMISRETSVLHPSLRRGPDTKEIEGRASARQPRDFEDTFATIDRRRFFFHPDRPAVQTVDTLGAGLDTDLNDAVAVANALASKDVGAELDNVDVPIAYMRTTRRDGVNTIINIGGTANKTGKPMNVRRLVTISRNYGGPCEVQLVRPREVVRIHVLLSYSQRSHRLAAFLKMFALYFSSAKTDMVRIVVSTTHGEEKEVKKAAKKHPELTEARFGVVTSDGDKYGNFSRAVAMREAAMTVPKDEIIFLADADLAIGGNFLQNCRVNVVNGFQVWFPIFFSLYPYGKKLSSRDGLWRRSSYGMACMYRGDFDAVGGFGGDEETVFAGWGSEDVFLYNRFRDNDKYAVFRSLEPGLQHQWHGKDCERNEHYENCMRTVYMTIGSQEAVAKLMAEEDVDVSSLTKDALPV